MRGYRRGICDLEFWIQEFYSSRIIKLCNSSLNGKNEEFSNLVPVFVFLWQIIVVVINSF